MYTPTVWCNSCLFLEENYYKQKIVKIMKTRSETSNTIYKHNALLDISFHTTIILQVRTV